MVKIGKISRNSKSGKDEGAIETKFTVFYKNVLISLQIKLHEKGRGQCPGAHPLPTPLPRALTPSVKKRLNDFKQK